MATRLSDGDPLFGTVWVHVFEEDTKAGAVFRPEKEDIPLSRRPRQRVQFLKDGDARLYVQGDDDRFYESPGSWVDERGAIVVRAATGGMRLRVLERSADRLLVDFRK